MCGFSPPLRGEGGDTISFIYFYTREVLTHTLTGQGINSGPVFVHRGHLGGMPMENRREKLLLEEYRLNVELMIHDDRLRQQRITNFLTANSLLALALGAFLSNPAGIKGFSIEMGMILLSLFGLGLSLLWYFIQARNSEYIRFRRFQLRSLEARLGYLTTFRRTHMGLNLHQPIEFSELGETFSLGGPAKASSTYREGSLPFIIIGFWGVVLLKGLLMLASS